MMKIAALAAVLAAASLESSHAMETYLQNIPNGSAFGKTLGHMEEGYSLNDFGKIYTSDWAALCEKEFPGTDKWKVGEVLGDPCCKWTKGGSPEFTVTAFTGTPTERKECAADAPAPTPESTPAPGPAPTTAAPETPATTAPASKAPAPVPAPGPAPVPATPTMAPTKPGKPSKCGVKEDTPSKPAKESEMEDADDDEAEYDDEAENDNEAEYDDEAENDNEAEYDDEAENDNEAEYDDEE